MVWVVETVRVAAREVDILVLGVIIRDPVGVSSRRRAFLAEDLVIPLTSDTPVMKFIILSGTGDFDGALFASLFAVDWPLVHVFYPWLRGTPIGAPSSRVLSLRFEALCSL